MSAVIEALKLRNFGGYREADVEFSAGLNLIRGRNSTGKSTLLDGLVFALFGEAPDARPKLLVSRLPESREMSTYVRFRSPKSGVIVEVTRRGRVDGRGAYRTEERRLALDGEEIEVEGDEGLRGKVTELMGSSLRKFTNLVYVRQGKLADILQPPKEEMDSVIGITLLRELREQVEEARRLLERHEGRDVATELENLERLVIPQLEKNSEQLGKDVEALREDVSSLEDAVRKGESEELAELLKEIEERDAIERKVRETRAKAEELLKNAGASSQGDLERKIGELMAEVEELLGRRESLEREFEKLAGDWSNARGEATAIEARIGKHEELLGKGVSKCPTCGQELDPETIRGILEGEMARLEELKSVEGKAKKAYDEKKLEIERLNKRIDGAENSVLALRSAHKALGEHASNERSLKEIAASLEAEITEALGKLGLPFQPGDPDLKVKVAQQLPVRPDELARKKAELSRKRGSLEEKVRIVEKVNAELVAARAKVEALRRRLVSANMARTIAEKFDQAVEARRRDFLKNVERKALEYYKEMTDQRVYAAIRIDPEEYAVLVHPKGLTEPIPAARVGGGHQTIIALSVRLALLESLGFRSLLILDEPTYGVDSENLPQLASYLGEVSRKVSQTILVTHHNICEEEALNIVDVRIGEGGASKAEVEL
ncbi:MAG: AAA family ATPase [Candidatus Brockarchaeota archaeon]|nr:AAA family ATPase [Candidatus Brockarchaeota archaeon]